MKPDPDWRRDAYLGWLYAFAWRTARGDRVEADRLWRLWCRFHGV